MFLPFNSKSTNPANWNQVNMLAKDVSKSKVTQVFNDKTNRRVLLGKGKNDFYGLKVSKPDYDVYDATDDQLIFNSDNNVFKIVLSGETSITPPSPWSPGGAGKQRKTIAHGLGYTPAILVYVDNPAIPGVTDSGDGLALIPNPLLLLGSYAVLMQSNAHIDSTNLYIDLIYLNSAGSSATGFNTYTWDYKYYLLQETAN